MMFKRFPLFCIMNQKKCTTFHKIKFLSSVKLSQKVNKLNDLT